MWLAGGGVKGGLAYGNTDQFGKHGRRESGPRPRSARDDFAPDGSRPRTPDLSLQRRDFRLTDVHGQVVKDLLA